MMLGELSMKKFKPDKIAKNIDSTNYIESKISIIYTAYATKSSEF